jgi:hypothetical protein
MFGAAERADQCASLRTLYAMKQTYKGSCHCSKVQFEVDADVIEVRVCDCSICRRRGALIHRVEEKCFRLLTPIEELSLYQWHTRTAKDYFCPTCGILSFRRPRTAPELWGVNVRCLEGVDLSSIPIKYVYGSRLD